MVKIKPYYCPNCKRFKNSFQCTNGDYDFGNCKHCGTKLIDTKNEFLKFLCEKDWSKDRTVTPTEYENRKIVAIDFDGTLCKGEYPNCEFPNMKLIEYIKKHRNKMFLILNTCRQGEFLDMAIDYMKDEHNITFDLVNENPKWKINKFGDCRKIGADIYIDDSSYTTDTINKITY